MVARGGRPVKEDRPYVIRSRSSGGRGSCRAVCRAVVRLGRSLALPESCRAIQEGSADAAVETSGLPGAGRKTLRESARPSKSGVSQDVRGRQALTRRKKAHCRLNRNCRRSRASIGFQHLRCQDAGGRPMAVRQRRLRPRLFCNLLRRLRLWLPDNRRPVSRKTSGGTRDRPVGPPGTEFFRGKGMAPGSQSGLCGYWWTVTFQCLPLNAHLEPAIL